MFAGDICYDAIVMFDLSISLWVVWGRPGLVNLQELTDFLYQFTTEVLPLVGMQHIGNPESQNPMGNDCGGDIRGFGLN